MQNRVSTDYNQELCTTFSTDGGFGFKFTEKLWQIWIMYTKYTEGTNTGYFTTGVTNNFLKVTHIRPWPRFQFLNS
jgi:hypothetical protein